MHYMKIKKIKGREVLDSRGNPTVEAEVILENGTVGRGIVPSGASTGKFEALELRDGMVADEDTLDINTKKRYQGKGVQKAVQNVNSILNESLKEKNVFEIDKIDEIMIQTDGTKDKSKLGANAILGVSIASAKAASVSMQSPLYQFLGEISGIKGNTLPVPMMNILNGGEHAKNTVDFQEFMIMPVGACCFKEALRMGTEVYHALKTILEQDGKSTAVGDEGGFAPDLKDAFEVFDYLTKAVEKAGYQCGKDIVFAMDAAASELYEENSGMYYFPGESKVEKYELAQAYKSKENPENTISKNTDVQNINVETGEKQGIAMAANTKEQDRMNWNKKEMMQDNLETRLPDTEKASVMRTTDEMISLYEKLCDQYPLYSIEDGLHEEDWDGWRKITERLGNRVQLVGDDLFVTNTERLNKGINERCANSILIKLNQIGTISETINAVKMAQEAGYTAVMSHRSGETEDTTIADMAVALNCGQIKTGAPCRTDRVAKYNQLLRIEEELGEQARYPGKTIFQR